MHTLNYTWLFKIIKSNSTKIYHKWRYLKVYDTKLFQIILSKTFQKHSIKASTEKSNSWGKENTWLGRASFPAHSHLSQAPHLNKSICCLPKKKKKTRPVCCPSPSNRGEIAETLLIIWKLNSNLNLSAILAVASEDLLQHLSPLPRLSARIPRGAQASVF